MSFNMSKATRTGVPDGTVVATVVEATLKPTRDGHGKYVNVKWRTDAGATFYIIYNVENKSDLAVNIGLADLGDIFEANGKPRDEGTTEQMLGMRCLLTVRTQREEGYGDKVKVSKYEKAPEQAGDITF